MSTFNVIGRPVNKIDSLGLSIGEEKFTDDFYIENPLEIAILYSPHPYAEILSINTDEANAVEGVKCIFHCFNTERVLHTTAGQGFPEPSPYDSCLFDSIMRFVGDRVAMVAAETQEAALKAVNAIKVEYKVFTPLFDPEKAMDSNSPRIACKDAYVPLPVRFFPEKNIAAEVEIHFGDLAEGFESADFTEEHTFKTQYASHCAIEPHQAISTMDARGRYVIVTATQVPFHVRRIVSRVLNIPAGKIRVVKPRIGGGFGGKQEVFLEPLVALVTQKTGRAARIVLSRKEVFISSRTRHPMRTRLKLGFKKDGTITALEMDCLMNTGAYGSHALTVLGNGGAKVLPLFNKIENMHFLGRSVYTNLPVGGAYRGYGATQTYFAYNQLLDMVARKTHQDFPEFCKRWHIKKGETSGVFEALGEGKEGIAQTVKSCKLSECIDLGVEAIKWDKKQGKRTSHGDKVRGIGMSISMQGSSIPLIDMGSAYMKINDDGSFNLSVGATDIGTGSDTILAQIAAEVLQISIEKIIVLSSDTDLTPFDVGAYASSTTYISGGAVEKCARKIEDELITVASEMLNCLREDLEIENGTVISDTGKSVSYEEIALYTLYSNNQFQIQAHASNISTESPPPFIAQFAEVDVDMKTGRIDLIKFVSAVDCGQPLNPTLVEGQVEGAVVNGINYALWEEYQFDSNGRMKNPGFWDYKFYTTQDIPEMTTIVVQSYEETGPFGAKSVGEIAINGPMPAIANAFYDATGIRLTEAPFTPDRVLKKIREAQRSKE